MKKTKENQLGITMIALIVTVIVLLILAGISIATLNGDSGIIKKSKEAKEQTEISEEKEVVNRAIVQAMGNNKKGDLIESNLQEELDKIASSGKTEVTDTGEEFEILFKESNRYYTIDKEGNILEQQIREKIEYAGDITKKGQYDGSSEKPYKITCIEDLVEWSNKFKDYERSYIELEKNLNFKSRYSYADSSSTKYGDINNDGVIEPIIDELGKGRGFAPIRIFYGSFNGNNKKISNIYINDDEHNTVGFFGEVANGIKLKNVTLSGEIRSSAPMNTWTGAFFGTIKIGGINENGIMENCHNYANVYGNCYAGGLIGYVGGSSKLEKIINCSNHGTVQNTVYNEFAGGLIANTDSLILKIEKCYNTGNVKGCGLTANNKSTIENCYNTGNAKYGLVGANQTKIINCYNIGICSENSLIHVNGYTESYAYKCFSEKQFANKIIENGKNAIESQIYENGYMKTMDFFNLINENKIWKSDMNKINNGYPIFIE